MALLRASFSRLSFVWLSSELPDARACPWRVCAARLAESARAAFFSLAEVLLPEPPCFSPPPDCLLTVAQARASASSLARPLS